LSRPKKENFEIPLQFAKSATETQRLKMLDVTSDSFQLESLILAQDERWRRA
jgi:hypothetical protein